jgi:hypothetical protein
LAVDPEAKDFYFTGKMGETLSGPVLASRWSPIGFHEVEVMVQFDHDRRPLSVQSFEMRYELLVHDCGRSFSKAVCHDLEVRLEILWGLLDTAQKVNCTFPRRRIGQVEDKRYPPEIAPNFGYHRGQGDQGVSETTEISPKGTDFPHRVGGHAAKRHQKGDETSEYFPGKRDSHSLRR